jgi:phospholipase/carboxylesterase
VYPWDGAHAPRPTPAPLPMSFRPRVLIPALALLLAGCWDRQTTTAPSDALQQAANGRLQAQRVAPTQGIAPGLRSERITPTGRPFGVYVPATVDATQPTAVLVLLHGRGGSGEGIAIDFRQMADTAGLVIVAPNSRGPTWDLILNDVGFDVAFIDGVLKWTFDRVNVDPARLTLGGFSDGATYATWLGLRNGQLFSKLAVFSGCATLPTGRVGTPKLYVTHGTTDAAFPIDDCARVLVPGLTERAYDVRYLEYTGGHIVPVEVADSVFSWIVGG